MNTQKEITIELVPLSSGLFDILVRIKDKVSQSLLADASVEIYQTVIAGSFIMKASTNVSGVFIFGDMPAGTYVILAKKTGYTDGQGTITVP